MNICWIHWKLRIKQKPELFCKYLRNGSSDLHENLYGGQILSWELKFKISWRSVHKCARTIRKRARARFIAITCVYNSCARIYAPIWMKFDTYDHKIVIDHHIKFHEDPSFRCGDISITISFWILWFSMYFSYFHSFTPKKSYNVNNYWMVM